MVQLFKSPTEKGDDEFQKAYEKGVNLGRMYWSTAVTHFQEASVHYAQGGNPQKASEAKALALLFPRWARRIRSCGRRLGLPCPAAGARG